LSVGGVGVGTVRRIEQLHQQPLRFRGRRHPLIVHACKKPR
jgi:hypothetical protein